MFSIEGEGEGEGNSEVDGSLDPKHGEQTTTWMLGERCQDSKS